jgi:ATP-dependent protease Clp ATPase subunit
MTPQSIKAELDNEIFGQEKAKDVLSFAFYLHLLRNQNIADSKPNNLPKSNVLILGSTGSGKRLMVNIFSKNHDLPCLKIDSNLFLSGQNFNDLLDAYLRYLIMQFGVDKAKSAILVFEDFDKIVMRQNGNNNMELQDDFLGLIELEDKLLHLEQDKPPILFPLHQLMFIFSGKFSGMESLIYMRSRMDNKQDAIIQKKTERLALIEKFRALRTYEIANNNKQSESIGFKNKSAIAVKTETEEAVIKGAVEKLYNDLKEDELEQMVETAFQKELLLEMQDDLQDTSVIKQVHYEDLLNYGMQPELISRIGFIAPFERLTKDEIIQILRRPSGNVMEQYKQYFTLHGNKLEINDATIVLIAKEVEKRNVGTRSINTIMLQLLEEYLYKSPNTKNETFIVDEKYFNKVINNQD